MPANGVAHCVEQRIVEQAARVREYGAVTGWAALRMAGAGYFSGGYGAVVLPVPLAVAPGTRLRPQPGSVVLVRQPQEWSMIAGIVSILDIVALISRTPRLRRRQALLDATDLADPESGSPPETSTRLVWVLDAGLPRPLCNHRVYDEQGRFIAVPDLLDPTMGVVAEYDGAEHASTSRRRRDAEKDDLYRRAGLEPFRVVGPDLARRSHLAERMRAAYQRASLRTTEPRWRVGGHWQER